MRLPVKKLQNSTKYSFPLSGFLTLTCILNELLEAVVPLGEFVSNGQNKRGVTNDSRRIRSNDSHRNTRCTTITDCDSQYLCIFRTVSPLLLFFFCTLDSILADLGRNQEYSACCFVQTAHKPVEANPAK